MGSASEDRDFTAVLCLSRDVEVTAERVADGIKRYHARSAALADAQASARASRKRRAAAAAAVDDNGEVDLFDVSDGEDDSASASASASASVDGGGGKPTPKRARGSAGRGSAARGGGSAAAAAAGSGSPDPAVRARALAEQAKKGADPTLSGEVCSHRLTLPATPPAVVAEYEAALRAEAYASMAGLEATHAYHNHTYSHAGAGGAGVGGGGGGGGGPAHPVTAAGQSMKRRMRVAAEMSSLPSLAVHWASSILIRADSANMDVMRAAMIGPMGACVRACVWRVIVIMLYSS